MAEEAFDAQCQAMAAHKRQLDAAWLEMMRAIGARDAHRRHGFRDVGGYVASLSGERRGRAKHDADLADQVADNPIVHEALSRGEVSKDAAEELVKGAALPVHVQRKLVEVAKTLPVDKLGHEVKREKYKHGLEDPKPKVEAHISRNPDGGTLRATLDAEQAEIADVALHAALERLGLHTDIPIGERRVIALTMIFRYFLEHVDNPAMTRVGRPHVLALVDIETLMAKRGGVGRLQSGATISGDTARRIACDAGVSRVITRGKSEVLDVGRATREPTAAMAKAVIARDGHCTEPGCHAPPWACEIHHHEHWGRGGHTSLGNLRLVCWYHHKREHAART